MGLTFQNLDADTRTLMSEEIATDTAAGTLYVSNYLSDRGAAAWARLLAQAASTNNDDWLANQLRGNGNLKQQVERRTPSGGTTLARVPVTAPETMAEGEFNRFYVRAICLRAIAAGSENVVVYRARASENPRPESEALIGRSINAQQLLADLRASNGVEAALGLARPNSGLSVKLP